MSDTLPRDTGRVARAPGRFLGYYKSVVVQPIVFGVSFNLDL